MRIKSRPKNWLGRVLATLMAFVTALAMLLPASVAQADEVSAMQAVRTMIGLARGNKVTADISNMEPSDWTFIGTYLSNWYAPFTTDVGSGDITKEETRVGKNYKELVQKLVDQGFNEKAAQTMVKGTFASIKNDSVGLHFGYCRTKAKSHIVTPNMLKASKNLVVKNMVSAVSIHDSKTNTTTPVTAEDNNTSDSKAVAGTPNSDVTVVSNTSDNDVTGACLLDTGNEEPVTFWSLMAAATGSMAGYNQLAEEWFGKTDSNKKTALGKATQVIKNGNDTRFAADTVVVYADTDKGRMPVFTADMAGKEFTASQLALINILQQTNMAKGYGNSWLLDNDKTNGEKVGQKDDKTVGNLWKKNDEGFFAWDTPLKLSPFGDIIADGKLSKLIIMPGCTNPYTFITLDKDGKAQDNAYGAGYPMTNAFAMQGQYTHNQNSVFVRSTVGSGIQGQEFENGKWKNQGGKVANSLACDFTGVAGNGNPASLASCYAMAVPIQRTGNNNEDKYIAGGALNAFNPNGDRDWYNGDGNGRQYQLGSSVKMRISRGEEKTKLDGNSTNWAADILPFLRSGSENAIALEAFMQSYAKKHKKSVFPLALQVVKEHPAGQDPSKLGDDSPVNKDMSDIAMPWFLYRSGYQYGGLLNVTALSQSDNGHNWERLGDEADDGFRALPEKQKNRPVLGNMVLADDLGVFAAAQDTDDGDDGENYSAGSSTADDGKIDESKVYSCPVQALISGVGTCVKNGDAEKAVNEAQNAVSDNGKLLNNDVKSTDSQDMGGLGKISYSNKFMSMLYANYAWASEAEENADLNTVRGKYMGWRIATEWLPTPKNFEWSAIDGDIKEDQMSKDIKNYIWYLLNPTNGFRYKRVLISNLLSGWFIGWHNDMVGTSNTGSLAGTTKYTGYSGYVTTPNLDDMEWTSKMAQWYKDHLLAIIMVVFLILAMFVVTNTIGLQKAIVSFIIFVFLSMIPIGAINAVVNTTNTVSNQIYANKFMYWALAQNQMYQDGIDKAASEGDLTSYMKKLYGFNETGDTRGTGINPGNGNTAFDYNSQGGNNIRVRWQAPKKMNDPVISQESDSSLMGLTSDFKTSAVKKSLSTGFSGENFLDDTDDYFYRDYSDIGNYSKYIYGALTGKGSTTSKVPYVESPDTSWWPEGLKNAYANKDKTYANDLQNGIISSGIASTGTPERYIIPFGSNLYKDGLTKYTDFDKLTTDQKPGIAQNCFNYGVSLFNQYGEKGKTFTSSSDLKDCMAGDGKGKTDADFGSISAYALLSESPFFWSNWVLYDQGLSLAAGSSGNFKSIILPSGGLSYFYSTPDDDNGAENLSRNGNMKDYLDMKGLFTYVMPYLRMGNDYAKKYMETFGAYYYDGITSDDGHADDYADDPVALRKYYHNNNLKHVYEVYSPWVDLMDDASYAKAVTISYNGKKAVVENPLDPSQYPEERPMVFSKAEQEYLGLKDSQLTEAERRIQKVETNTQKDFINLLNYYTFNDTVLSTAAAMSFTFNFNRVFSDSTPFDISGKDSVVLYPQNFELKNFTYDAYLRLIINSSTAQPLDGSNYAVSNENAMDYTGAGFYAQTVANSSFTTALGFIVLDVLAIYLIPALKLFFVVGLFLMLILLLLLAVFRLEDNTLGKLSKTVIKPLVIFTGITLLMSAVVSLFMSSGSTAVTGEQGFVIKLGDPTLVVWVQVVLNLLVAAAYIMLAVNLGKALFRNGKALALAVGGVVGGLGKAVMNGFKGVAQGKGFKSGYSDSLNKSKAETNSRVSEAEAHSGAGKAVSNAVNATVKTGRNGVLAVKRASRSARSAAQKKMARLASMKRNAQNQSNGNDGSNGNGGAGNGGSNGGNSSSNGGKTQGQKYTGNRIV